MTSARKRRICLLVQAGDYAISNFQPPPRRRPISRMVMELLMLIGKGEAVTLVPIGAQLTTQQAADMLNVSRPFLIKLLEDKQIPYHMVGTHRRIRAQDVFSYKHKRDAKRIKALDELAKLGQEIDAE